LLTAKVGHKHYSKQTSVRGTHFKDTNRKIVHGQKSLINSTIAKEAIENIFACVLSTFGENDELLTKPLGLSLKNNFCDEISSIELSDLHSKQGKVY
jgi:hypothetical protein